MSLRKRYCIDRWLPEELEERGREVAAIENLDNTPPFDPLEAAGEWQKFWKPGRTLRIAFIDNVDAQVRDEVMRVAKQWCDHANITFDFADHQDAEIRITFKENDGSWSAVGTDALVEEFFPRGTATMNYGWLTRDSTPIEYSRVVLHEFGHALGLIHEHQNPAAVIRWNEEVVIADLMASQGWDLATIRSNVLDRYSVSHTRHTEFDEQSIMLYAFPSEWTLDGLVFPENSELSETDIAFIKEHYPRKAAPNGQALG